jgi:LemA protein
MVYYVILGVIVTLLVYMMIVYNQLVTVKQRVNNAWSQVDVQLKLRYDLVGNLVETVKAYAAHEKETLENVTMMRNKAMVAQSLPEQAQAENKLEGAVLGLLAVAENYPALQADANFRQLQQQLKEIEDKIAFARMFFNDTVLKYNLKVHMFPSNLVAYLFQRRSMPYFSLDEQTEAREGIEVKF